MIKILLSILPFYMNCRDPDGDRMVITTPPDASADAVLNSLNWGQSASNEYECFVFDVICRENRLLLSGWYIDPKSNKRITAENVPLTDEQAQRILDCLRTGTHLPFSSRQGGETVYDMTSSSLSVCWKMANDNKTSVKYDGRKEEALLGLLKSFFF